MPHRVANEIIRHGVSLRTRLTLWVVGMLFVIQTVTSVVVYLYQWSALDEGFNQQLRDRASTLARAVSSKLPDLSYDDLQAIALAETRYVRLGAYRLDVLDGNGQTWVRSNLEWPEVARDAARLTVVKQRPNYGALNVNWFDSETAYRGDSRFVTLPITGAAGRKYALIVATPNDYTAAQLALVTRMLMIAGGVSLLASAISGWYIAGLAVEPLRRFQNFANQLGPESISKQINIDSRSIEVAQLNIALEQARVRIEHAFAAQERFLSNISHEIKTPIATLLIEAQTIKRDGLSKEAVSFVRTAEEEMRRLGKLVESFLTLTRVNDGKGLAKLSRVLVNEIVLDSTSHCASMAKIHAVSLRPQLLDDDETVDTTITGDPDLLRTMVDNLVRNAIRFSPRDTAVTITAKIAGGSVVISVEDEGPGLPEDLIPHVFDRFVQAPDEIRKARGHGLGLAIAQGVAELHGGQIQVENRPTVGARFTVRLPISHRLSATMAAHIEADQAGAPTGATQS